MSTVLCVCFGFRFVMGGYPLASSSRHRYALEISWIGFLTPPVSDLPSRNRLHQFHQIHIGLSTIITYPSVWGYFTCTTYIQLCLYHQSSRWYFTQSPGQGEAMAGLTVTPWVFASGIPPAWPAIVGQGPVLGPTTCRCRRCRWNVEGSTTRPENKTIKNLWMVDDRSWYTMIDLKMDGWC